MLSLQSYKLAERVYELCSTPVFQFFTFKNESHDTCFTHLAELLRGSEEIKDVKVL